MPSDSYPQGFGTIGGPLIALAVVQLMMIKMFSHDLMNAGIIVIAFHPGRVKTTMLHCKNVLLEPVESISCMIRVIESLQMADSGRFLDWQGNKRPW